MVTTVGITEQPAAEETPAQTDFDLKPVKVTKRQGKTDIIHADFDTTAFHFGWVPTDSIKIGTYQRKLRKPRAIKMAHTWNQNKVGIFVVNHNTTTGEYKMLDGQHRLVSMKMIEDYPSHIYCQIFENLTHKQQAIMFHDLDSDRENLTPGASFVALIEGEDPVALGIKAVAENLGFSVDYRIDGPKLNHLRAYKTLQDIFRRVGATGLTTILSVARDAWPNKAEATSEPMLRGLEVFFQKYPNADYKRIINTLSATNPMYVIGTARRIQEDLSSVIYTAVAQTIRGLYNKGLRYKLPEFTN